MTADSPWEPPFAGTEAEHLAGALDRLRVTFRWKADGLGANGLRARIGASALTLGGLLKHLALVEDSIFVMKFRDELPMAWAGTAAGAEDWEFESAAEDPPERLYAYWDDAVARSRATFGAAMAGGGLDQPAAITGPDAQVVSLRRLVCDLIEEYGRHTGHADLLRESVDGLTGEDPPPGWRPRSGRDPFAS
ncbi:DUF664 domain-containing protein [Actinoplanes sp. NPDC051494]|uniref:mycothiol transferase n=1 Tax=Actinoplanes sp. NPDC051494 TaxID=3363907 RepID=UPI0037A32416